MDRNKKGEVTLVDSDIKRMNERKKEKIASLSE